MLGSLRYYLILLFILVIPAIPNQVVADGYPEMKKFCMWKASAAQIIAMNRDFGLNQTEITGQYLNQEDDYNEQVVVLNLIDRIYGTYEFVTHDTIYLQTNKTCLRDLYIDKSSEVFLSLHIDKNQ
ncbi:MAG: hypothetical protein AB8B92_08110 [Gammaproteobacteria bacterium]